MRSACERSRGDVLCILDHDGTRTHLGPGGPFPKPAPKEAWIGPAEIEAPIGLAAEAIMLYRR